MNKVTSLGIIVLITISLSGCGSDSKVESCVDRGITYFKDIGSYPTLLSKPNVGKSSEAVARERCNKTTSAF